MFHIGCDCALLTIFSQQKRALNLVHALLSQCSPPTRIAIVGGGIAGITAAAALLSKGNRVSIYEKSGRFINLQYNNSTRYLHPNIYDWPQKHASNARTDLPFLNWTAGLARDVADELGREWNAIREWGRSNRLLTEHTETIVHPNLTVYNSRTLQLSGNQSSSFVSNEYDCVILAIGFGLERSVGEADCLSYWATDTLGDSDKAGGMKRIFISGIGDGGLTDLLRARIEGFRHERIAGIIEEFRGDIEQPLLQIERAALSITSSNGASVRLWNEYDKIRSRLGTTFLRRFRDDMLRPDTSVVLNGRGAHPLSLRASILNRFLTFLVANERGFRWAAGRVDGACLVPFAGSPTRYQITLEGKALDDVFHQVIVRHGTDRPILDWSEEEFPINSELGSASINWPTDFYPKQPPWPTSHIYPEIDRQHDRAVFLTRVANIYSSLKFDIWKSPILDGKCFDLRLRRIDPGLGQQTHLVQCIHSRNTDSGQAEISKELEEFKTLDYEVDSWIFVSPTEFDQQSHILASKHPRVRLVTLSQLEEDIFSVRDSYKSFIEDYRRSPICESYIALAATDGSRDFLQSTAELENVEKSILDWIITDESGFLFVLGDYGSGKTTLLQRLKFVLASSILSGSEPYPLPVFLRLKDFYESGTVANFISRSMALEFGHTIPETTFWAVAQKGRFLFLLDGFDEMSNENTARTRSERMLELSRFLKCNGKSIVTCRPAHYASKVELQSVGSLIGGFQMVTSFGLAEERRGKSKRPVNKTTLRIDAENEASATNRGERLKTLHDKIMEDVMQLELVKQKTIEQSRYQVTLKPLDENRIKAFLAHSNAKFIAKWGIGHEDIRRFLDTVYDLSDLVRRPILLNIIVYTILEGGIDPTDASTPLNSADLYKAYTSIQFKRDILKGPTRRFMPEVARSLFGQSLALTMLYSERLEVSYQEVIDVVRKNKNLWRDLETSRGEVTEEEVAGDVLTCSFVTRSEADLFRFSHKSFMEYFVALSIVEASAVQSSIPVMQNTLNREILLFLGAFAQSDPKFFFWVAKRLKVVRNAKGCQKERDNLGCIVFSCNGSVEPFELRNANIVGTSSKTLMCSLTTLSNVTITDAQIGVLRIVKPSIESTAIYNCEINAFEVIEGQVSVSFASCNIGKIESEVARFSTDLKSTTLKSLIVKRGIVSLSGSYAVNSATTSGGELSLKGKDAHISKLISTGTIVRFLGSTGNELNLCNGSIELKEAASIQNSTLSDIECATQGAAHVRSTFETTSFIKATVRASHSKFRLIAAHSSHFDLESCDITESKVLDCKTRMLNECKVSLTDFESGSISVVGDRSGIRTITKCEFDGSEIELRGCDVSYANLRNCKGRITNQSRLSSTGFRCSALSIEGRLPEKDEVSMAFEARLDKTKQRRTSLIDCDFTDASSIEGNEVHFEKSRIKNAACVMSNSSCDGLSAEESIVEFAFGNGGTVEDLKVIIAYRTKFQVRAPTGAGKKDELNVRLLASRFNDSYLKLFGCHASGSEFFRSKILLSSTIKTAQFFESNRFDNAEIYFTGNLSNEFRTESHKIEPSKIPKGVNPVGFPVKAESFNDDLPSGIYLVSLDYKTSIPSVFFGDWSIITESRDHIGILVSILNRKDEKLLRTFDEHFWKKVMDLGQSTGISINLITLLANWLYMKGILSKNAIGSEIAEWIKPEKLELGSDY